MSPPALRTRDASILIVLLIVGATLSLWTAGSRDDCGLCMVNLPAAVLGNFLAAGAILVALGFLAFRLSKESADHASSSIRTVLIVLGLGVLGAIISVFALNDRPFVTENNISGSVAGTAIGVAFLYVAFLLLVLDLQGVFSGGHKRAPSIPQVEEDQHVMTIEGIGPKYATRLNARGIITIPQLLSADAMAVAKAADCTHQLVEQWQAEGALIQVKGIGPQFAEMLALVGIRSVQQLASSNVDQLLDTIDDLESRRKTRVLKVDVQRHHVEKLVKAARAHLGMMD